MLTLTNLTKRYGSLTAVDGLSLSLARGEIFGLLGPNGAGKSTTVLMSIGVVVPDGGDVTIEGVGAPTQPAVRARIGVAPQAVSLYEPLTGEENLAFLARLHGLSGATRRDRVAAALEFVGLADRRHDRVDTYSGGMKRRLNLAAAVLHDPELIVLDEPTVGVDPQSRNLIFENVLALKARGRTILYTTHYMEEAARLCDRIGIVDRGKLLALDTVAGLVATHGGAPVLTIEQGGTTRRIETRRPIDTLNEAAREGPIEAFHLERPTLEEVFLRLTGRTLRD